MSALVRKASKLSSGDCAMAVSASSSATATASERIALLPHHGNLFASQLHRQFVERAADTVHHLVHFALGDNEWRAETQDVARHCATDHAIFFNQLGETAANSRSGLEVLVLLLVGHELDRTDRK